MNNFLKYSAGLLVLISIGACNITRQYQSPQAPVAAGYRDGTLTDSGTLASMPWQELFADTILQRLIQQGLDSNTNLRIAIARMKAASANLKQSKAAFYPSLTADADYTINKTSQAQLRNFGGTGTSSVPTVHQYALTATSSWEIDVWGKLRSTKKAAVAAFLQSDAYRRAVQTQLIADIASQYYALLAYDRQLLITQQTIEIRRKDIETVKALKEAATLTGADVAQSEAALYAAEVSLPDIRQNIRETENALCTLLGQAPATIARDSLSNQLPVADLKTGVPAQLLRNRPDVLEAEYNLRNAFELTNVARTYFYPSLTISGTGGWATANTLKGFFDGTFYGNLVSGLTQPIFAQGQNKQRLKVAEATQEEALYNFKATVLTASEEVSNALFSYNMATEKKETRSKQLVSLEKSVDYTKELLKFTSNTNYTDVLTSETNLLTARLNGISDQLQQLQAIVELYRALGGGWQ